MPDASILSSTGQIAGGVLKAYGASNQLKEANAILKGLQYPIETLPDEYQQNQNLAQTMASTGMPAEQYNLAMKNIQRQQMMALRKANDRRGGLNVLPQILQGGNDATLKLDAASAGMRTQNQRNLLTVNNQVAGVKRDLFDKNIRDKYLRDYYYAQKLKGVGNQNLYGSADQVFGALTAGGSGLNSMEGGY